MLLTYSLPSCQLSVTNGHGHPRNFVKEECLCNGPRNKRSCRANTVSGPKTRP